MSIYTYTADFVSERITPPLLRLAKHLAWIRTFTAGLKWNSERFTKFIESDSALDYDNGATYSPGTTCRWTDNAIYFNVNKASIIVSGIKPRGSSLSDSVWVKVQDNYIGIDERMKYTGQLITLQYALNRLFRIESSPFLYIENGSTSEIKIYVPLAVYTTLGATNTGRDQAVVSMAEKHCASGTFITVASF